MFDTAFVGSTAQYGGTPSPGDGYGTCTNVYCHSTVQSSPPGSGPTYRTTGTWGTTTGCDGCHYSSATSPSLTTGSHQKHFEYRTAAIIDCAACHNYGNQDDTCFLACHSPTFLPPAHVNRSIDVIISPGFGGSYDGSPVPGVGYGSCSNTYCHSNGTSVATGTVPVNTSSNWGSGLLLCSACHGNPPGYVNGSPKANSHMFPDHQVSCNNCHESTTSDGSNITNKTVHVDMSYDVTPGTGISFTYLFSTTGGTCSSVSCHSGGATQTWGQ